MSPNCLLLPDVSASIPPRPAAFLIILPLSFQFCHFPRRDHTSFPGQIIRWKSGQWNVGNCIQKVLSKNINDYYFNTIFAYPYPFPMHTKTLPHCHLCQPAYTVGVLRNFYPSHQRTVLSWRRVPSCKKENEHSPKHQENILTIPGKYQVNRQIPRVQVLTPPLKNQEISLNIIGSKMTLQKIFPSILTHHSHTSTY